MNFKIDKSKWTKVRLGDVATEYSKRVNNPSESGFDRFVGNSNIGQWDFRVKTWESTSSVTSAMKQFEPDDYLLVRRSLYASDFRERAPRAHFSGLCSGDIITIRENPERVADGFLIGVLNSPALWKFVVANASGSITRRIKWKDLANYEFLLPPKEQQAEIAELLWAKDNELKTLESLNKKAAILRKTHFCSRVGDGASSQENWKVERLRKFANIVRGSSPRPAGSPELFNGDYLPWVTVGLLTNNKSPYLKKDHVPSFLTKKGAKQTRIIPPNTVLLSNSGYSLGVPTILTFEAGANDGIAVFLTLDGLEREYLYYYLDSKTEHLRTRIAAGADQPNLNTTRIGNIQIPVPPVGIQKEIVKEMLAIDDALASIEQKNSSSKRVLQSLINQVF